MRWPEVQALAGEVWQEFNQDEAFSQAAALAFYTALGLAPTILLVLSVTAFFGEDTKEAMVEQIQSLVGDQAAEAVNLVVEGAREQKGGGVVSALIGVATMLFSASGIFVELQGMLNRMWNVRVRANQSGYMSWLRQRVLSLGMVFGILFLLLASLVVSAGVAAVLSSGAEAWTLLDLALSWLIYVVLFALIFKFLPDADIQWRDVWVGAALTALLFAVGKYAIGLYLGNSALASSYGAAGTLVVLLLWVYYSSLIVFFGAELTQVYARHYGGGIQPAEYAEAVARTS